MTLSRWPRRWKSQDEDAGRPPRAPWTTYRKTVVTVTAVIVAAALSYGGWSLDEFLASTAATCVNGGLTVVTHESARDSECVGITDGAFNFVPSSRQMAKAGNEIKREDAWVRGQHRAYATVAYLLPISAGGGGIFPAKTTAEQLAGVYAAQHWANQHNVEGTAPLIQVLIANAGTQAAGWPTAVRDIEKDVRPQHLVAVGGIGLSLSSTMAEVRKLARDGFPVFAGTLTSDAFDNIQNMVRVTPSNAQYVSAIQSFAQSEKFSRPFLIQDTDQSDGYAATLVHEFRSDFQKSGQKFVAIESYDTTGEVSPGDSVAEAAANRISQMSSDICASHADVVLFGGRGRDLATLVAALAGRPCRTTPITVVTGDDGANMPVTAAVSSGLRSNVSLDFAGDASPAQWAHSADAPNVSKTVFSAGRQGFSQYEQAARTANAAIGVTDNDGYSMITYDNMLVAISAIRLAGVQPSPSDVAMELSALEGSRAVDGATGPMSFSADYQSPAHQGSNPVAKVIPILRVEPGGAITFVQLEP